MNTKIKILVLCVMTVVAISLVGCTNEKSNVGNSATDNNTKVESTKNEQKSETIAKIEDKEAEKNKDDAEKSEVSQKESKDKKGKLKKEKSQDKENKDSKINQEKQDKEKSDGKGDSIEKESEKEESEKAEVEKEEAKIVEFDKEKVEKAKNIVGAEPYRDVETFAYKGKKGDAVTFKVDKNPQKMWDSVKISKTKGLEFKTKEDKYTWAEFGDDLDYSKEELVSTVKIKGDSFYQELEVLDNYEEYYRYFDENEGIHYEIIDIYFGDLTKDKSQLEKQTFASVYNMPIVEKVLGFSKSKSNYAPGFLGISNGKTTFCTVSTLDGKPTIYREITGMKSFAKEWIDIETGVTVKSILFNEKGLATNLEIVENIKKANIPESTFKKPENVKFNDKTLIVLAFSGMVKKVGLEALGGAMENLFDGKEKDLAFSLKSKDEHIEIYAKGIKEEFVGFKLDEPVYVYKDVRTNKKVREFFDDRFYTVYDDLKKVVVYDDSCLNKKFFNMEDLYLLNYGKNGDEYSYKFYEPESYSVSGLHKVYEYVVKDNKFKEINTYFVKNFTNTNPVGTKTKYKVESIKFDKKLYDLDVVNSYQVEDRGKGSFYDGEHPMIVE